MRVIYFFIILSTIILTNFVTLANEYCIAKKVQNISYGSNMYYAIECSNGESIHSDRIITTFLLPIPYHWGKAARKRLYKLMKKKGFSEVARIPDINERDVHWAGTHDYFHVFSKNQKPQEFMILRSYEEKNKGLDKRSVFNVKTSTIKDGVSDLYKGLSKDEVITLTNQDGFERIFSFSNDLIEYGSTVSLYFQ